MPFTQSTGYAPKHPEVLRIHPLAKVPVLVDGDVEPFDSTLILEYLDDAYPEPALYPQTPGSGRAAAWWKRSPTRSCWCRSRS